MCSKAEPTITRHPQGYIIGLGRNVVAGTAGELEEFARVILSALRKEPDEPAPPAPIDLIDV